MTDKPEHTTEYIRVDPARSMTVAEVADTIDAQAATIKSLVEALGASVATIEDYLAYEHDGDPWTEDARAMREMDIDDYAKDGRLTNALATLANLS